jgi:opacity protein-like surface antigen
MIGYYSSIGRNGKLLVFCRQVYQFVEPTRVFRKYFFLPNISSAEAVTNSYNLLHLRYRFYTDCLIKVSLYKQSYKPFSTKGGSKMKSGRKHLLGMVVAVNVLSVIVAGNVMADDGVWRANYAQVKLGAFQPTGDLDDADFDAGPLASVAYGRYLTRYLSVETSIEGFGTQNDDIRGTNTIAGSYELENTLATSAFLVTLKGEYPVGPVSFFGGIGGGFYVVTLDSDVDTSMIGDFSIDDDDSVFGAHVVAGANYDITDRFFIGLEGMYRWTDDVDLSETVALIPVEYSGDLSGFSVTVNAGFRF